MDKRIFSVIIPAYNAEKTIERALASLISSRDYINEVLLVDDHSTDNTIKKAVKFSKFLKIRFLCNHGVQSPGVARKLGLLHANGEWVTFLDADDCLTSSSLRYVYEEIQENKNMVLLYAKTIYYEFGTFTPDTIEYMDSSCGGNFYKKEYLVKNSLYPHDLLYMAEDQYFNDVVYNHIAYCDHRNINVLIGRFDYPVYEAHHDPDDKQSFAHRNFVDYVCKYHLLYKEYVVERYKDNHEVLIHLIDDYVENFIFCFFAIQGLFINRDIKFDYQDNLRYFARSLNYFENTFLLDRNYMISYFDDHSDIISILHRGAIESVGCDFNQFLPFESFVNGLYAIDES